METKNQPSPHAVTSTDGPSPLEAHEPATKTKVAKLSREEEAKLALEHTIISISVAKALCALFLLTIFSVPLAQFVVKMGGREAVLPSLNNDALIPRAADLKHFESDLESGSVVAGKVLPQVQNMLTRVGVGTENAYLGREGWLAYRPDFNYVTGRGFLEPNQLHRRSLETDDGVAVEPNPVTAILRFRDQLAKRRIRLILLPTPLKPMLEPQHFAANYASLTAPLQNPSYKEFLQQMQRNHVMVCDPTTALFQAGQQNQEPQFLRTDTHWTPEAMHSTAEVLSGFIDQFSPLPPIHTPYTKRPISVSSQGDIAAMLKLPAARSQELYPSQQVGIDQVLTSDGQIWHSSTDGDVLLLGDSFTNIYSRDAMGWGSGGGLAEQLSYRLQRPLDVIGINAGGSFATRRRLRDELDRDPNRLRNTRVVIWQFAMRDLQSGNWQSIDLPTPTADSVRTSPDAPNPRVAPVLVPENPAMLAHFRQAITQKVVDTEQAQGKQTLAPVLDGSGGWMFYLSDARYVTSHAFLQPGHNPQVDALVDFKKQLDQRDIKLVVMPVPAKATIYPEMLGLKNLPVPQAPQNPSFADYRKTLEGKGIQVFDPVESLLRQKHHIHTPLYMPTDSHWTFEGMESTAGDLAANIRPLLPELPAVGYTRQPVQVANITDISYMLQRQPGNPQAMLLQQTVQQVHTPDGEVWKASPDADVLVMGDSFTNIYSHGGDWGKGAGLAEQLSYHLQRPVDLIAMDSGAINDTRRALQKDLLGGRDRLAGKKVVVYEIAARYLMRRDWDMISLSATGQQVAPTVEATSNSTPASSVAVRATVESRSEIPDAANTPYPDLVMTLHLTNLRAVGPSQPGAKLPKEALVYVWALRKAFPAKAASWKRGQTVELNLTPWNSVEDEYGSYNRTELKGSEGAHLDAFWGEVAP